MKKIYSAIISVILVLAMACSVSATCIDTAVINEYDYLSQNNLVHVTENITEQVDTYETVYENLRSIWVFDNKEGTITFKIYKDEILVHDVTILNPEYYPEEYGISDTLDSNANSADIADDIDDVYSINTINQGTEDWWGYKYYYNTDSAKEDVYWRLFNPNSDIFPSKKYFFASYGSDNQDNAMSFMDCVIDMESLEEQLAVTVAIETIKMIQSAVSLAAAALAGSPAAIASLISGVEAARDLTTAQVELTASIYSTALMADSYYLDVVDEIIEYR